VPAHGKTPSGDLLVTVSVAVPKKLTRHQRTLVEQLATALNESDDVEVASD
jgi:DnaJ-class molecular chaperone